MTGMSEHKIRRRIFRKVTDEEQRRHEAVRDAIEREKPELKALGRRLLARQARLREALAALKATRESLGLSLQDVGERTGIGKANLSRLESARNPNPKIDTLARYAEALGKDLLITFPDAKR